uniref:Connector enhancer of kinase suppressor of ras n=1 Tax=Anopheles dirus TaxID=7168 RepID=A0A182NF40_9DIPT
MAYINVAEWSTDMVTDWLKGLDNSMYHYVQSFTNNGVGGKQLLNIRPYELEQLGMHVIGHQEIVLEAVENLKNFNYNLDKENLQFLALHVATAAHSLEKQLEFSDQEKLETAVLKDITRTITHLKALIEWLDRAPFRSQKKFDELRKQCMRFGLEMATVAMRDRFSLMPVQAIRQNAKKLAKIGEYIIKDIMDPIILQPASLDLVTLKKRESDLGFLIMQSFHGVHRITEIKFNSPAHNSGKVEEGDEIVQINYQTVVGWEYKKVLLQLQESPPDVILTLKKRPKHTKIYGQIYIKPYRLPSKKRSLTYRWGESLPSPRATDTFALQDFSLPLDRVPEKHVPSDSESDGSDILTPTDVKEAEKEIRLYLPKPRAVLQRRHTLSSFKDLVGVASWHERKGKPLLSSDLQALRDKSVSFGFGLEMSPRPTTTCLGLTGGGGGASGVGVTAGESGPGATKCSSFGGLKSSLPDIVPHEADTFVVPPNDRAIVGAKPGGATGREEGDSEAYKAGVSKVVRFESSSKADQCHVDTKYTCKVDNTVLETFEPIPYVDEDLPTTAVASAPTVTERVKRFESFANRTPVLTNGQHAGSTSNSSAIGGLNPVSIAPAVKPIPMQRQLAKDPELAEAINTVVVNREMVKRGRLDKSYSTPAYDDEHSDVPPAIEPRKEHLLKAPPVPPPRPKRTLETLGSVAPEKAAASAPAAVATVMSVAQLSEPAAGFVSSLSNTLDSREDSPNKSKLANVIDLKQNRAQPPLPAPIAPGTVTPPKPAERTAAPPIPASRPAATVPPAKPAAPGASSEPQPLLPPPTPTVSSAAAAAACVPSLPTDSSSELLTPNKTKSLTLKKKNSLLSKRRNVSLKTLCVSDIQGHLYRRTKDRSGMSYWAKYYFVLIETTLYGFRSKEAPKANSMIFLAGFTITLAKEVHSRPHAFKVYHPNKTFYFAAETQEALVQWMEYIKQATLKGAGLPGSAGSGSAPTDHHNVRELFSETDSSDDELGLMDSTLKLNLLCTPSPQTGAGPRDGIPADGGTPTSSKSDRYHLNFGSLKKFTKIGSDGGGANGAGSGGSAGHASNSSGGGASSSTGEGSKFFGFFSSHRSVEKSNSSEMPVPTSQFKSYRKVPGAGGGLQIGTASVSTEVFPMQATADGGNLRASNLSLASGAGEKSAAPQPPPRATTPPTPPVIIREPPVTPTISEAAELLNRARKTKRISPHNYIHASNPNLVEFDFQTSKAMDFSVPKIHAANTWDTSTHSHSNLQSMITLKDLMLQKQAEEAQDMYNKRVCLGVEKLDDRKARLAGGAAPAAGGAEQMHAAPVIPESVNKIQRRQLPITPDYAQSFKLDDEDILYTRSKEGQKLRDFGYEMISGDDAFDQRHKASGTAGGNGSGNATNAAGGGVGANGGTNGISSGGSIKKKTFNWINSDRKGTGGGDGAHDSFAGSLAIGSAPSSSSLFAGGASGSSGSGGGGGGLATSLSLRDSFKRSKNKAVIARLDNIKASSEKLFQFKQSSTSGGGPGASSNNDKESLKTKQLDKAAAPGTTVNVNLKHQPAQQHSHQPHPLTPFASIVGGLGGKKNNNELNAALEHHSALLFGQGAQTAATGTGGAASAFMGGIKKSNTCNSSSDFKENSSKAHNMRKNSAPERGVSGGGGNGAGGAAGGGGNGATSYFTKLSFGSTKTAKEKKLLGSPGLHRAIFGKNHHHNHGNDGQPTVIDHEVFSPISYTKAPAAPPSDSASTLMASTTMPTGTVPVGVSTAQPMATSSTSATVLMPNYGPNLATVSRNSPDYPNMEYPPVFEAETYSLSDPNASLTLLKRRQNHHHHPHHHHQK